jgi:hypothetical protein
MLVLVETPNAWRLVGRGPCSEVFDVIDPRVVVLQVPPPRVIGCQVWSGVSGTFRFPSGDPPVASWVSV